QFAQVQAACKAVLTQLRAHEARDALTVGKPEQTIVWFDEEFKIWCRIRLDWLVDWQNEHNVRIQNFYDLKTTTDANPQKWVRRLFDLGADIQAAFYSRGIKAVLGINNPLFRFIVVEVDPPNAISGVQLSPSALEFAHAKTAKAMNLWSVHLTGGRSPWPGYPPFVHHVDAPPWKTQQFEERQFLDEQRKQFEDSVTVLGAG